MEFYKVYMVNRVNAKLGRVVNVYAASLPAAKKIAVAQEANYKLYK